MIDEWSKIIDERSRMIGERSKIIENLISPFLLNRVTDCCGNYRRLSKGNKNNCVVCYELKCGPPLLTRRHDRDHLNLS